MTVIWLEEIRKREKKVITKSGLWGTGFFLGYLVSYRRTYANDGTECALLPFRIWYHLRKLHSSDYKFRGNRKKQNLRILVPSFAIFSKLIGGLFYENLFYLRIIKEYRTNYTQILRWKSWSVLKKWRLPKTVEPSKLWIVAVEKL